MAQGYWKVKQNGKWVWKHDARIAQMLAHPKCDCAVCSNKPETQSTRGDEQ